MSYLKSGLPKDLSNELVKKFWENRGLLYRENKKFRWAVNHIQTSLVANPYRLACSWENRKLLTKALCRSFEEQGLVVERICGVTNDGLTHAAIFASSVQMPILKKHRDEIYEYKLWEIPDENLIPREDPNVVVVSISGKLIPYAIEYANRKKVCFATMDKDRNNREEKIIVGSLPSLNPYVILLVSDHNKEEIDAAIRILKNNQILNYQIFNISDISNHKVIPLESIVNEKTVVFSDLFSSGERNINEILMLQQYGLISVHHFCLFSYMFERPGKYLTCPTTSLIEFNQVIDYMKSIRQPSAKTIADMEREQLRINYLLKSGPYNIKPTKQ